MHRRSRQSRQPRHLHGQNRLPPGRRRRHAVEGRQRRKETGTVRRDIDRSPQDYTTGKSSADRPMPTTPIPSSAASPAASTSSPIGQGDRATGMLASWVMQAGFEPPMVTVAVRQGRYVADWLAAGEPFVLNVVGDEQKHWLKHFGKGFEPASRRSTGSKCAQPPTASRCSPRRRPPRMRTNLAPRLRRAPHLPRQGHRRQHAATTLRRWFTSAKRAALLETNHQGTQDAKTIGSYRRVDVR